MGPHALARRSGGVDAAKASPRDFEARFTVLRYFALDGTAHASMIRRYIIWRNNRAYDERLCRMVTQANVA